MVNLKRISAVLILLAAPLAASEEPGLSLEPALSEALRQSPMVREATAESERARTESKLGLSPFLPQLELNTGYETRESREESENGTYLFGAGRLNLYNGGRDRIERKILGEREALASRRLELARARVMQETARAFFELLYINMAIGLKQEALKVNSEQRQIAKRIARAGITSSADVYEFEFRESSLQTELNLLTHEKNVMSRALSQAMGREPRKDLRLQGDFEKDFQFVRAAVPRPVIADTQLQVAEAESESSIAGLDYRSATATWLPRADLIGRYGNLRFADPEIRSAPAWNIGVNLTFPIFSGIETLEARRLKAQARTAAESRLRRAQLNSVTQTEDYQEKLQVLDELIQLQEVNAKRAEQYFKATLSEYKRGVKNAPDLAGATERLFAARDRRNQLQRDRILAYLGLHRDTSGQTREGAATPE